MDSLFSPGTLNYRLDDFSDDIIDAARDAATACGFAPFEEYLLCASVLQIRSLAEESVSEFFSARIEEAGGIAPDAVLRVDWRTWAIPRDFEGEFVEAIIERTESICVDVPTLLSREVLTQDFDAEYNWLYWEDSPADLFEDGHDLPSQVFEELLRLIEDEWSDAIRDFAENDADFVASVHPALRQAVGDVIAADDDEDEDEDE